MKFDLSISLTYTTMTLIFAANIDIKLKKIKYTNFIFLNMNEIV